MPLYKERGTPRPKALPPSTSWQRGRWSQIRSFGATVGAGDVILQRGTGGGDTHTNTARCVMGARWGAARAWHHVCRGGLRALTAGFLRRGARTLFTSQASRRSLPLRLPAVRFRSSISSGSLVPLRRPLLESGRGRKRGLEGARPSRWPMESRGSPLPLLPVGLLCS